jgi:hypothetical protein
VTERATLPPVSARDRTITKALVFAALAAWLVVGVMLAFISPEESSVAQLLGALAFGAAVTLTLWPLLWTATRSQPDSLITSGRRSVLAGLVVAILVILRAIDVVSVPVLIFVIAGAVVVEVGLRMRR